MANKSISGLTASASNLASTDVAPVVQTTGVGPVKMTGLQLAGGLLGSASFNGATVTTSQPVLNLSQTWNAGAVTFTGLKFNATDTASASGSLLLDIGTGGGTYVSKFKVDKSGNATVGGNITIPGTNAAISFTDNSSTASNGSGVNIGNFYGQLGIYNGSSCWFNFQMGAGGGLTIRTTANPFINLGLDTQLTRATTATLQLGAADAAAPVAQTLQVQSVVAGTSNTAGTNWTLKGSAGTGTGAGGSIIFQVAPAGSSGTAQNAYATALTIDSNRNVIAPVQIMAGTTSNAGQSTGLVANGIYLSGGLFYTSSTQIVIAASTGIYQNSVNYIGWGDGAVSTGTIDTKLFRDAANTLALRNGTNRQQFNVYGTYTDASNYNRLEFYGGDGSGNCSIQLANAGTGAAGSLNFNVSNSSGYIRLLTNGTVRWDVRETGHFLAGADNAYDIGASGANRPRNVYVAGTGTFGNTVTVTASTSTYRSIVTTSASSNTIVINRASTSFFGTFEFQTNTTARWAHGLRETSDEDLHWYNHATGADALVLKNNVVGFLGFGSLTSSFPALKRSSATLQVRLADDSAFAPLACSSFSQTAGTLADGANAYSLTATMPASPTGAMTGVSFVVTSAGSVSQAQSAAVVSLAAGYTGSSSTNALNVSNAAAGTSVAYAAGGAGLGAYRTVGNRSLNVTSITSTSGINVGVLSSAISSTTANYAVWGSSTVAVNSSWNVGVAGFGLNTGTGTQQVGGFFALYDGGTNAPNLISGALVADNGTTSSPVFLARVNNATAFTVNSTGSALVVGSGGLGYGTGAGGAVTQGTSRTTGVTINKSCGQITLVSAAGTTSWQSFTVSNTTVAATDTIKVVQASGTDLYQIFVTNVAANSFQITFATTGGTTTEQPVFSFAVIKAVTS